MKKAWQEMRFKQLVANNFLVTLVMKIFAMFLLSLFCFTMSCKPSRIGIYYKYTPVVEEFIREAIIKLNSSALAPEKNGKLFVKMGYCGGVTYMIFNYFENLPLTIQHQVSQSNRFLTIDNIKIPVLFELDDGNALVRELGVNHGILGGYLIEFDAKGKLLASELAN